MSISDLNTSPRFMRRSNIYKNKLVCFIWFWLVVSGFPAVAQEDFALVDSLIKTHQFPIAYPNQTEGIISNDFDSILNNNNSFFVLDEVDLSRRFDFLTHGIGRLDSLFSSADELARLHPHYYGSAPGSIIPLPIIHLVYLYPRVYRRKGQRYYSFGIDQYIKNWGDAQWKTNDYAHKVKIFDKDEKIIREAKFRQRDPKPYHGSEGYIYTIFSDVNYSTAFDLENNLRPKVYQWNHYSPFVYTYTIEVLNDKLVPYEIFTEKLGFRYIEEVDNTILINRKQVLFKSTKVSPTTQTIDKTFLFDLKRHNFNTIILTSKADEHVFNVCDSLGLFVVQEINQDSFGSLSDLLNYFMMVKDHPSFVMWRDNGYETSALNILKRLDYARPFYKANYDIQFRTINNWDSLDINEKKMAKNQFQIFKFSFLAESSTLAIGLKEPFELKNKILLRWTVSRQDSVTERGTIDQIDLNPKKAVELLIPFEEAYTMEANFVFDFQLELTEDIGIYHQGDVIAMSKFHFVDVNSRRILERIF
jgi:hypothetical protein